MQPAASLTRACAVCGAGLEGASCRRCGAARLVEVIVEARPDSRMLPQAARAVSVLGPPAPDFTTAQRRLVLAGGGVLVGPVPHEVALRVRLALEPFGVVLRVQTAARGRTRAVLTAGLVVGLVIALGTVALLAARQRDLDRQLEAARAESARAASFAPAPAEPQAVAEPEPVLTPEMKAAFAVANEAAERVRHETEERERAHEAVRLEEEHELAQAQARREAARRDAEYRAADERRREEYWRRRFREAHQVVDYAAIRVQRNESSVSGYETARGSGNPLSAARQREYEEARRDLAQAKNDLAQARENLSKLEREARAESVPREWWR